jgi:PAS domain S-box-containing protein
MTELPDPRDYATFRLERVSILLVDDNPANLLSLRALLDDLGQNLVEARTGEEAIERVKAEEFAIILLDVLMPGISGFETAKAIRGQDRSEHTPIIFLTASDIDRSQMEEGYALGAVDFLVKPVLPVALQAKVRGFVQLFQDKQRARHEADQLRLLVHGTTEYAIFMLDPQGRVVTWNAGAERIKQYKADQIIGQHFTKFYPQDAIDRGWPEQELKIAAAEGRIEDEGWRIRKDGSRFWANVVITALRDAQGTLRGFSKVTRDLTARKEAEESLRQSEERFRLLVETATDYAIFVLDPQGHVASWNAAAERIKQYKADEIIGQHFSKFYPQEALDRGWPAHELKVAEAVGRFEDEGWRVRKDGTQFWANVVITALKDEHGELRGFSKITRDMTARKQAEESARRLAEESAARRIAHEERERLHVTLASIGDAVISTDAQGRVDFLNLVAEELVGWKAGEAVGQTLEDVFRIINEDTRQPVENPALRALNEGKIVGLANHTLLISKDGVERPIDDSAAPIRDAVGDISGSVLVFRDISERKRNEAALGERLRLLALNAAVGEALVQGDSLPAMLQRCAEGLVEHLGGAFARIWTLDEQNNVLALRASAGMYTHLDGPHSRVPVGKYKIGLIAQEKKPHLTNAVVGDPRVSDQEWARREGMVAFAGYPLVVDDRLVGVMAMFARKTLSGATLEAMASVADEIAVGIERKTSQERLYEQREWLAVTLASIGDAVITTDAQGRVTFLNGMAREMTGWTLVDADGQSLEDVFCIINEQTREPVKNPVEKVLREGVIVGLANHTVLIARDGTERPIDDSAAPIRDSAGKLIGVVLIFRDVTEQRRAEQELRSSEARKSAVLQTALDCIITMDHQGRVVEFNPAAEKTFGYRRADIVGQELCELIVPPGFRDRHRQGLSHYLATGEGPVLGKRLELSAMRADGSELPVEVSITRNSEEGPAIFTAYLRDITEAKRSERHRNARLAVTHALSEAATVKEGAVGVLAAVCDGLGWDVGFLWRIGDTNSELNCAHSWHKPEIRATEFERASCSRSFAKGEGLPGSIWSTGQPAWILDVLTHPHFPRAASAAEYGLHSAFGCPVVVGDRTLGVIEFFTKRISEPDVDLLEMMGTVAGSVGQFLERQEAQDELRRSERELSDFFENATVGLHWVGPDGIILRANQTELDMLGYRREEYVGRPIADVHADEDVICDILRRLQGGEKLNEYPARLRCKDGSIKDVLIDSSVLFRDGGFVHTRCFTRDVTQRKRSEQTSRFLADASAALAVIVDFDSTLQKVASMAVPSFADWATVDLAEGDGTLRRVGVAHVDPAKVQLAHELHRRFPPDPTVAQGIWNIIRTGRAEIIPDITDELLAQSIHDSELLGIMRQLGLKSYLGVPLKVRGKAIGVLTFIAAESGHRYDEYDLATAQDLADRAAIAVENAQLYRELRSADQRKDEFLATLAHELRNPLAPIRNGLQVLRLAGGGGEMVEEARSMMERQLSQMVRLVDDLLDVSRITRNKLELRKQRVTLATVVHSAVETSRPLMEQAGHTFSLTLPPAPVYLDADLTRLAQVFSNLLNNAAKYTEPGGRISLTGELSGGEVLVRVRDNGLGIPADALPRIFEMFSQVDRNMERAQGGLGIGLTLVRRLVEMHGGTVEARSDGPGQGSEFFVQLPIPKTAQSIPSARDNESATATSKRRILVVDDNRDSATSLGMMLKLMGNETHTAHDGLAAIEAAEKFRPDLILLDIGLPKINGYDACRAIREQPWSKGMVIVALTGWGQEEDRRRSAEAGFDDHMVKPVEHSVVTKLLADL